MPRLGKLNVGSLPEVHGKTCFLILSLVIIMDSSLQLDLGSHGVILILGWVVGTVF